MRHRPLAVAAGLTLFCALAARAELPSDVARELLERGFVVLPGPVPSDRMAHGPPRLTPAAYAAHPSWSYQLP